MRRCHGCQNPPDDRRWFDGIRGLSLCWTCTNNESLDRDELSRIIAIVKTRKLKLHHEDKTLDIPQWGTCDECTDDDHEIEIVENKNRVEWMCVKCGYIEWTVPR